MTHCGYNGCFLACAEALPERVARNNKTVFPLSRSCTCRVKFHSDQHYCPGSKKLAFSAMINRRVVLLLVLCLLAGNALSKDGEKDDDDFAFKVPTQAVSLKPTPAGSDGGAQVPTPNTVPTNQMPTPSENNGTPTVDAVPTNQQPTPSETVIPRTPTIDSVPTNQQPSPAVDAPTPTAVVPTNEKPSPPASDGGSQPTVPTVPSNQQPTVDSAQTPTADAVPTSQKPTPSESEGGQFPTVDIVPTASEQPTPAASNSEVPILSEDITLKPTAVETQTTTDRPVIADTDKPSAAEVATDKPTVAETDKPVAQQQDTTRPTVAVTEKHEPVVVQDTAAPSIAATRKATEAPTVDKTSTPTVNPTTGNPTTDTAGKDNNDAGTDGAGTADITDASSSSNSVTYMLVLVIVVVGFILYRLYCKGRPAAGTAGNAASDGPAAYSRLPTSEESQAFLDEGDIEMHGGQRTSGFGDDAEIWEEWETNEEVNPPPSILQAPKSYPSGTLANAAGSSGSLGGGLGTSGSSHSTSRDDVQGLSHSRSNSNGGLGGLSAASAVPTSPVPLIPAPSTGSTGTLGTLGTLGNNKTKATGSKAVGGSSKSKGRNNTPPGDVDLFAVSLFSSTHVLATLGIVHMHCSIPLI